MKRDGDHDETTSQRDKLKTQILVVLEHPEAEEGLYFRNFFHLHEEDERPAVEAEEPEILEALHELIQEGKVIVNDGPDEMIFQLAPGQSAPKGEMHA